MHGLINEFELTQEQEQELNFLQTNQDEEVKRTEFVRKLITPEQIDERFGKKIQSIIQRKGKTKSKRDSKGRTSFRSEALDPDRGLNEAL